MFDRWAILERPPEASHRQSLYTGPVNHSADNSKFRAFVCYSHADTKWAQWVQHELETYRIPKEIVREAGLPNNQIRPIFRDNDELGSTHDLPEALQVALSRSEALIVVCSAAARESDWVNREIEYFCSLTPGHVKRVYCLIVDGHFNEHITEILPQALSEYDGLAADPRKSGDGPKRASLKLVSALVGVSLDKLVQRDRTRRRRRNLFLGAAATVVAVVFASLLYQSRVSSLEALEKTRAADELVTYMLADLDKRLDEFDGVATLDPGFDAALSYFESLETGDMSNETLERYFDALTSAGDLSLRQGNNEDALRIWERSSEISGRLIERDSTNANSWRRDGDSYVSLALASWGDPDAMIENSELALKQFEKAAEIDPDNFENFSVQVTTLNNLAAGYSQRRDFDTAASTFQRSLALNADLRTMTWPDEPDAVDRLMRQEAESATWMTEVELKLGRTEEAINWHEREVTIRRDQMNKGGDPVRLGDALEWGALAYQTVGDSETALGKRREARQVFEDLTRRDPDNFYWQRRYIDSTLRQALTDIDLGNDARAKDLLTDIAQRLNDLEAEYPGNSDLDRLLAYVDISNAKLDLDSLASRSLELANRAMARLSPYVQGEHVEMSFLLVHADAAAIAAYAMMVTGNTDEGRALAEKELVDIDKKSGGSNRAKNSFVAVILLWLAGDQETGDGLYQAIRDSGQEAPGLDRWRERLQN